jgi:hypothetical protein
VATSGARTLRHVSAETVEAFSALDRCARESELAELAGRIGQPLAVVELLVAQEFPPGGSSGPRTARSGLTRLVCRATCATRYARSHCPRTAPAALAACTSSTGSGEVAA